MSCAAGNTLGVAGGSCYKTSIAMVLEQLAGIEGIPLLLLYFITQAIFLMRFPLTYCFALVPSGLFLMHGPIDY